MMKKQNKSINSQIWKLKNNSKINRKKLQRTRIQIIKNIKLRILLKMQNYFKSKINNFQKMIRRIMINKQM